MASSLPDLKLIMPDEEQDRVSQSREPYELLIIGGGPAGMTAAVYSARKQLKTLLVSKDFGGQLLWTSDIENYMGYQYITGRELTDKFKSQMEQFPIVDIIVGDSVEKLTSHNDQFVATTASHREYTGKPSSSLLVNAPNL
jgi:alkyl hydroperoxide reductase subunit F